MKAIFKLNNKIIENEKIENISLLIKLGEEFKDSEDNEEYVINFYEFISGEDYDCLIPIKE